MRTTKASQAYQMFSEGKSTMEVAIALDMQEPDVTQLYKELEPEKSMINSIYLDTKGDLETCEYRTHSWNSLISHHDLLCREVGITIDSEVKFLRQGRKILSVLSKTMKIR